MTYFNLLIGKSQYYITFYAKSDYGGQFLPRMILTVNQRPSHCKISTAMTNPFYSTAVLRRGKQLKRVSVLIYVYLL